MAGVLPDILRPKLRVVFCGTAAGDGVRSGRCLLRGSRQCLLGNASLDGTDRHAALAGGVRTATGLRDRPHRHLQGASRFRSGGRDGRVRRSRAGSPDRRSGTRQPRLQRQECRPRRTRSSVDYGLQSERIGGAAVWVLPSTSGAVRGYWDVGPWRELARASRKV